MVENVTSEKLLMPASEEQSSKKKERLSREKKDKKVPKGIRKPVTEKKTCEFLKFIKHSE